MELNTLEKISAAADALTVEAFKNNHNDYEVGLIVTDMRIMIEKGKFELLQAGVTKKEFKRLRAL